MLSPDQLLSFVVGIAALVALVPAGVWIATGRPRAAWRALQSYGGFLFVLGLIIGAGALVGFIASQLTP